MIAPRDLFEREPAPRLLLGDEPADLARGRLLFRMEEEMNSRPPEVVVPGKGEVPSPTSLAGEDGEWLVRHARGRIPPDADWLRALAAVAEDGEPGEIPAGTSLTALREISVLLAAARRSAAHDLDYAFDLLRRPPEEVRRDARLRAFREETNRAVGPALRARPRFVWRVALLSFVSAEAIEDIVAARWRDELSRYVVLAVNSGYVADAVTFAYRSPPGLDGTEILLAALPEGPAALRPTPDGAGGRGLVPRDGLGDFLDRLRFRKARDWIPG